MVIASAVTFASWSTPLPLTTHRARLFASLPQPVSFATTSVTVQGQRVPVAIWCPESLLPDTWKEAPAYEYDIDVGRIALKLEVDWLSWLPARPVSLSRAAVPLHDPSFEVVSPGSDALIFAHGFLGTPFDMAHACEALASDGFLVVAPECPESLSASYEARDGLTREAIVLATQQAVDANMAGAGCAPDGDPRLWGIFGHSAGSATAILQPGEFALGRVCIATALGRCLETVSTDPLFFVASEGDGCNDKMRERGATSPAQALMLARVNKSPPFTEFDSARAAYAQEAGSLPRRGVLLFRRGRDAVLPNHISFLWRGTNEALFELLAPLLPLARALNLFLLDFDEEKEAKLAEPTAEQLVPAMRRFFGGHRLARDGRR